MSVETKIAELQTDMKYVVKSIDEMKKSLGKDFVTRREFNILKRSGGVIAAVLSFLFTYFKFK